MTYTKHNVELSSAQLKRLQQRIEHEQPIEFTKYTTGEHTVPLLLTDGQLRNFGTKPLKLSVKQMREMKKDGGFLASILKVLGSLGTKLLPALKVAGPALATGALTGAASYGANKILRETIDKKKGKGLHLKPSRLAHSRGKGLYLKPYRGGNVTIELTPCEVNSMLEPKEGGFLPILASLAAGLLPTLLGSGLSSDEVDKAKKIITKVGMEGGKKKAQEKLNQVTAKYGKGLLGKLFKLPGGKIPVLGDIPILNMLF